MTYSLDQDGFQIIPSALSDAQVETLRSVLKVLSVAPGHRNLTQRVPEIASLAISPQILDMLEALLGTRSFPVRSIYFDKTPETNWLVPFHQDLSIATKKRVDVPGYGPWSVKDGVPHVQPPMEILETMATVRLHLDDCDDSNGPLRVIPGSHRFGRVSTAEINRLRSQHKEVNCRVKVGDALIMRPLLLHASSEAINPSHRRVIHLEYATCQLPRSLEWAESLEPAPTQFHSSSSTCRCFSP